MTLQEESVTIRDGWPYADSGIVSISVDDENAKEVRVLVECNGQRSDITVKLTHGYGSFDVCKYFSKLKNNETYTVKLINVPEMCF